MAYVYAEHGIQLSDERIAVWWDQFHSVPAETAGKAARILLSRKSYGPPKAHDFAQVLSEVQESEGDRQTWGEAWDIFATIALRLGYYRMEEILPAVEKRSPLAAAAMRTGVREFLTSEESDVPTIRAQFRQRFEALQERGKRDKQMPEDMRRQIDGGPAQPTPVKEILPGIVNALVKRLEAK
jgi:hypothetical protein